MYFTIWTLTTHTMTHTHTTRICNISFCGLTHLMNFSCRRQLVPLCFAAILNNLMLNFAYRIAIQINFWFVSFQMGSIAFAEDQIREHKKVIVENGCLLHLNVAFSTLPCQQLQISFTLHCPRSRLCHRSIHNAACRVQTCGIIIYLKPFFSQLVAGWRRNWYAKLHNADYYIYMKMHKWKASRKCVLK